MVLHRIGHSGKCAERLAQPAMRWGSRLPGGESGSRAGPWPVGSPREIRGLPPKIHRGQSRQFGLIHTSRQASLKQQNAPGQPANLPGPNQAKSAHRRVGGAKQRSLCRGLTVQTCPRRHEAEMKASRRAFNFPACICRVQRYFWARGRGGLVKKVKPFLLPLIHPARIVMTISKQAIIDLALTVLRNLSCFFTYKS